MDSPLVAPLNRVPYHLGIATCDLERARSELGELLGVAWSPMRTAEGELPTIGAYAGPTKRMHSLGGPMRVELIEGTAESVWATTQIAELHHYAYWSADVASDVQALVSLGWRVEMTTDDSEGRPAVFAYLVKPGHIRIEFLADSQRPAYEDVVGVRVARDVSVSIA